MALLSSALNIFGAVLLAHAVYSAHEHSTLATIAGSPPVSPVHSYIIPTIDLPLDI
ncbi:hypothetical protein KCV01_g20563, partial [Aureobasidium melanogenum]